MLKVQISRGHKGVGKPRLPAGWHWDNIRLEDFDLWIALDGEGEFYANGQIYPIVRGTCFILRPGIKYGFADAFHLGRKKFSSGFYHIYVHFDCLDENDRIMVPETVMLPEICHLQHLPFIEDILTRAIDDFSSGQDACKSRADFWLTAALHEIERQNSSVPSNGTELHHAKIIETVCSAINEHPQKDFRVDDFAKSSGYSLEHFSRIFKQLKGLSPCQYIVQARIEAAKSLLLTSSMTISEIALATGYSDVYFFSRQFHRKSGLSPSQFRSLSLK